MPPNQDGQPNDQTQLPSPVTPSSQDVDAKINAHLQSPLQPLTPAKRGKKTFIIILLLIVLLATGGGAGYYFFVLKKPASNTQVATPETVDVNQLFQDMLAASMDVSTFRQTYTFEAALGDTKNVSIVVANCDFSDIKNIKVVGSTHGSGGGITREGEFVLTKDADYIQLVNYSAGPGAALPGPALDAAKGKWARVSVDKTADQDAIQTLLSVNGTSLTAVKHVAGEMVIGNIDTQAQANMLQFAKDTSLYSIKAAKRATLDGAEVIKYDITHKQSALKDYVQLIGEKLTSPPTGETLDFGLYVDIKTKLPKRVEISLPGNTLSIDYDKFSEPIELTVPNTKKTLQQVIKENAS